MTFETKDAYHAVLLNLGAPEKIHLSELPRYGTLAIQLAVNAYEAHRPENMDEKLVFHRAQAHVYNLLMSGENVALSAPTSFGKSLIIDAAIASGKYRNIVIVVPTLALIDETRRRLTQKFGDDFKVITRSSQQMIGHSLTFL